MVITHQTTLNYDPAKGTWSSINTPVFSSIAVLQDGQMLALVGSTSQIGSGGGNHTHLKKFMRLLSVL